MMKSLASIALLLPASLANDHQESELPALYHIDELPRPLIRRLEIEATGRDSSKIVYVIERRSADETVIFSTILNGIHMPAALLPAKAYPSVDLTTVDVSFDEQSRLPKITVRFGEERECFSNYDGRDYASILFKPSSATVRVQSFENCGQK